ncbi:MAG: PrgI family protein [Candidatus Ryanbacteria bacterium]|nr:PrgI family protein [Candidatus Ryanbacteria bacterium]
MQQFQVPQFIDVEDKVFGPLTIKQFIYLIGGAGSVMVLWFLPIPGIIFWPLAIAFGGFFGALAFLKVNGQPFVVVLNNAVNHMLHTRFYVWKRAEKKETSSSAAAPVQYMPKLTQSKLKDLAWSLDINNKLNAR